MHGRAYVSLIAVPDLSPTDTDAEAGRVRPSASNPDRAMRALAADSLGANEHRPDLTTRRQIHDLVVAFYRELVNDVVLGPVFEEVAEVDWSHHIPLLIDYWCRILLGDQSYQGTLLMAHRRVHDLQPFTTEHFDRWYGQWYVRGRLVKRSLGPVRPVGTRDGNDKFAPCRPRDSSQGAA